MKKPKCQICGKKQDDLATLSKAVWVHTYGKKERVWISIKHCRDNPECLLGAVNYGYRNG